MHGKLNIIIYFLLVTLLIISAANLSYSQNQLNRVEIKPLNRATIFFSEKPKYYKSELTADKRKINIFIDNTTVTDSARTVIGKGIIENVYANTIAKKLEISVLLKEKRGYTAVLLPYSQAIMVDVFQWEKLAPDEDSYRSGLLALEDQISATAKELLTRAVKLGNPDAACFLGILYLKEGNTNLAIENLQYAIKFRTTIPDAFAALSQVYRLVGDNKNSQHFATLFGQRSQLTDFKDLEIVGAPSQDSSAKDQFSLSRTLLDPALLDSFGLDLAKGSSTASSGTMVQIDTPGSFSRTITNESKENSIFPQIQPWVMDLIKSGGIVIFGIGILVIYMYLRWRRQQVIQFTKTEKSERTLKQDKSKNMKVSPPFKDSSSRLQPKTGSIIDKTIDTDPGMLSDIKELNKPELHKPVIKELKPPQIEKKEKPADNSNKDIEQLLVAIRQTQLDKVREAEKSEEIEEVDLTKDVPFKSKVEAKLELALHLAQEQQKIKKQNIESIEDKAIPADANKLSEVAKKLGIEKSSLETKKSLEQIKKDEPALSRLAEKFSIKKND